MKKKKMIVKWWEWVVSPAMVVKTSYNFCENLMFVDGMGSCMAEVSYIGKDSQPVLLFTACLVECSDLDLS